MLNAVRGVLILCASAGAIMSAVGMLGFTSGGLTTWCLIGTAGLGFFGLIAAIQQAEARIAQMLAAGVQDIARRLGSPR